MNICNLCPRNCNIDRNINLGFCKMRNNIKIARADLHMWEEPSISGEKGSGTVFFSGCNLKCIYCQNKNISHGGKGREISLNDLTNIFLDLQKKGAHNINLVTPSHYVKQIVVALKDAKKEGLTIPIIYNSGGYDSVEEISLLNGLIDIYMPDFKYFNNDLGNKFSSVNNYVEIAKKAIDSMYKQVGKNIFDHSGMLKRGLIIRHLVLPGHIDNSKKIIKYLYDTYGDNVILSIMNQYTPIGSFKYPELNRSLYEKEYNEVINYAISLGVDNAYIQEGETCSESFIPDFDM